jgi:hypothetical protein
MAWRPNEQLTARALDSSVSGKMSWCMPKPLDVIASMEEVRSRLLTGAPMPPTWLTRDGALRDIDQRIRDLSAHVVLYGNAWRG